MILPRKVLVREVAPRDGLQSEDQFVSTKTKVQFIKALMDTGLKAIEITSFVHPQAVPQLQDAEEVCSRLELSNEDIVFSALVGNARGVERALKVGMPELVCVISASETHNKRNMKMTVSKSLEQLQVIAGLIKDLPVRLRGAIGTSFGCPYEGSISTGKVTAIVDAMMIAGIQEVSLGDTAGLADPRQVYQLITEFKKRYPQITWGLHLHDTRGTALANVLAGLQAGVEILEGSVGGVGGCPFIAGAAGNVTTEDMVYMLHRMGVSTGVDLGSLVQSAGFLEEILGRPLPGKLLRVRTY